MSRSAAPVPAQGRVGQEELVELSLQRDRKVPRAAPPPHLVVDLPPDLVEIGPGRAAVVGRVGAAVAVPTGMLTDHVASSRPAAYVLGGVAADGPAPTRAGLDGDVSAEGCDTGN